MFIKYIFLFGWSLVLLFMLLFAIRVHPVIRKKKEKNLNLSEGIYTVALLICAVIVLAPALENLAVDYDISQKLYTEKFLNTFIETGSIISLAGMGVFLLLTVTARGLSIVLVGKRLPLVEFDADNVTYALIRSGLMLAVTLLLVPFYRPVFQALLPMIATPFYG